MLKKNRTNLDAIGQGNPNSQRERANIERKSAEHNNYDGLSKACYWGLAKVNIQVLLTCIVVNCKRMAGLVEANCGSPREALWPG